MESVFFSLQYIYTQTHTHKHYIETHIHTHFILNPSVSILKLRGENDNHNKNEYIFQQKKNWTFCSDENGTKEFYLKFYNIKKHEEENENERIRIIEY